MDVLYAVYSLLEAKEYASLLITGHSLGGALATFAAVDIMEQIELYSPISIYTFGSPRTGN